ncbi:MAG: glycosyltransferase family A protein [Acidobacteriaceae bacterium]
MGITVILCTYNRATSLALALDSLAKSVLPGTVEWEVLVVDNNSGDRTREVVDDFCARYPGRFRYLFEPQQGKSFALNAGIRATHADILAFVDDDVTVEPSWLHNLTSVLQGGGWAGSGGRVLPVPGFLPPRWLSLSEPRNLGMALCAQFDLGTTPGELRDAPFGTNMAFRRELFDKFGGFRGDLGPSLRETRNEDTEFGRRLMAAGERLYYVPSAIVYHEIRPERVRKQFFLNWWFDRGRGAIREDGRRQSYGKTLRSILRTLITAAAWLVTIDPERRFYRQCMIWFALGKLVELRHTSGKSHRSPQKTAQPERV